MNLPRDLVLHKPEPAATADHVGALPTITVVTPSFNQAAFLETTIRSVLSEGYPALEYFVIDGGSTDGSRAIIEHYAPCLSGWVSEPDRGQVDALLKGLARATGDWFNWINSDDVLAPGALWKIARTVQGTDVDLIAGSTREFDAAGRRREAVSRRISAAQAILEPLQVGARWHQPGTWLRRQLLVELGLDPARHYRFDYELLIRYLHRHPKVRYLPDTLAWFRLHEQSKTVSLAPRFRVEHRQILEQLSQETEFAALRETLDLGIRAVRWLDQVEALQNDRGRSRWQRLYDLVAAVNADRAARCTIHSREIATRILLRGG